MMKRLALMFAATAVLAIPASSAFSAPRTNNVLPGQLCFAAYPWQAQPVLCGKGDGSKPEG